MSVITSDRAAPMAEMLEGYDCPAILVSADYEILATNKNYEKAFGAIDFQRRNRGMFICTVAQNTPCLCEITEAFSMFLVVVLTHFRIYIVACFNCMVRLFYLTRRCKSFIFFVIVKFHSKLTY